MTLQKSAYLHTHACENTGFSLAFDTCTPSSAQVSQKNSKELFDFQNQSVYNIFTLVVRCTHPFNERKGILCIEISENFVRRFEATEHAFFPESSARNVQIHSVACPSIHLM